jgi:hypothetical protein
VVPRSMPIVLATFRLLLRLLPAYLRNLSQRLADVCRRANVVPVDGERRRSGER